jgi:hypothetical protein
MHWGSWCNSEPDAKVCGRIGLDLEDGTQTDKCRGFGHTAKGGDEVRQIEFRFYQSGIRVGGRPVDARTFRGRGKPIEAVETDGRPRSVFVADEVLVDGKDHDLI